MKEAVVVLVVVLVVVVVVVLVVVLKLWSVQAYHIISVLEVTIDPLCKGLGLHLL